MNNIPQAEYDRVIELIPIVCVDIAVEYENRILLIKRRNEPAAGQWWLPGGRLYKGEDLGDCALRKAKEEVGLECALGPMLYYKSIVFEKIHSVNFVFLLYAEDNHFILDDTCLDYRWIPHGAPNEHFHDYIKSVLDQAQWG